MDKPYCRIYGKPIIQCNCDKCKIHCIYNQNGYDEPEKYPEE